MNIGDLLRAAFLVTWRHKWMWLVGFLLSPQLLGESIYKFNYLPGEEIPWEQLLAVVLLAGFIGVVMFIASILINPALILAALRAQRNQPVTVGGCFRDGSEYFVRYLLLALTWLGISLAVVIMLVIPLLIAAVIHLLLLIVVALFFVPVLIAVAVVIYAVGCFSYRSLVVENLPVLDALQRGYALFKSRLWPSVGLAVVALLITLAISVPLTFLVLIPQQILTQLAGEGTPALLVKYGFSLLISIPVYGYLGAWNSNLWTVAYEAWYVEAGPNDTQAPVMTELL